MAILKNIYISSFHHPSIHSSPLPPPHPPEKKPEMHVENVEAGGTGDVITIKHGPPLSALHIRQDGGRMLCALSQLH